MLNIETTEAFRQPRERKVSTVSAFLKLVGKKLSRLQ